MATRRCGGRCLTSTRLRMATSSRWCGDLRWASRLSNDPLWYPMEAAIDLREQQTGDLGAAVLDLEQAMASGKLRSMRRNRVSSECERVAASFWKAHVIDPSLIPLGSVTVYRRRDRQYAAALGEFAHQPRRSLWTAGCSMSGNRILTGCIPAARRLTTTTTSPPRVKPGKKPTGDWPTLVAQWLSRRCGRRSEAPAKRRRAGHRGKNIFAQPDQVGAEAMTRSYERRYVELLKFVRR